MTDFVLVIALVVAALWTVMTSRLLRSGIGLAVTSALLAIILFRLMAPIAGAFELSVCAGLIPVIFITTISFTRRLTGDDLAKVKQERFRRFWFLPLLMVMTVVLVLIAKPIFDFPMPSVPETTDVRTVMWGVRHLDLFGQIAVLLAGAFGVVVFFKESRR